MKVALDTRFPLSFGKLAFRAAEPAFCNLKEFDATLKKTVTCKRCSTTLTASILIVALIKETVIVSPGPTEP